MAINFSPNDVVRINTSYVTNSLPALLAPGDAALQILGYLGFQPSVVRAVGHISGLSFIQAVPLNISSTVYNSGSGAIVYFPSDTTLNDSFELSNAFLPTQIAAECLNNSGSPILKGQTVYYTGYNGPSQQPTIALASAAAAGTATFFGIADEDISNGDSGDIVTQGSYQGLDTSGFVISGTVFLSNTSGGISNAAGTVSALIGRVLSVAVNGAISIGLFNSGGGGGGTGAVSIRSTVQPTFGSWGQFAIVGSLFTGTGLFPPTYPIIQEASGPNSASDRFGNYRRLHAGGSFITTAAFRYGGGPDGGPTADQITRIQQRLHLMVGFKYNSNDITNNYVFIGLTDLMDTPTFESNILTSPILSPALGLYLAGPDGNTTWRFIGFDGITIFTVDTGIDPQINGEILYLHIECNAPEGAPPILSLYAPPDAGGLLFGPTTMDNFPSVALPLMLAGGIRINSSPSSANVNLDVYNGYLAIEPFLND